MKNFKPNTELYGRIVQVIDEDGNVTFRGALEKIISPHTYMISGYQFGCDQANDFSEEFGQLILCGWMEGV